MIAVQRQEGGAKLSQGAEPPLCFPAGGACKAAREKQLQKNGAIYCRPAAFLRLFCALLNMRHFLYAHTHSRLCFFSFDDIALLFLARDPICFNQNAFKRKGTRGLKVKREAIRKIRLRNLGRLSNSQKRGVSGFRPNM